MNPVNKLEGLLIEALIENGITRSNKLKIVKEYFDKLPVEQARKEITQIKRNSLLRLLYSVGIRGDISPTFLQTYQRNIEKLEIR